MNTFTRPGLLASLVLFTGVATAAPIALVRVTGPGNEDGSAAGSAATSGYIATTDWSTGSAGGGFGTGSAHIGTGELKAQAIQDNAVNTVVGMRTATRLVDDTLTFTGPGSGPWFATWTVAVDSLYAWQNPSGPGAVGSVNLETLAFLQLRRIGGGSDRSATARILHQVFEPGKAGGSTQTTPTEQVQFGLTGASASVWTDPDATSELGYKGTLSVSITVLPGETWRLEQGLEVYAQGLNFSGPNQFGWIANADSSHTAKLSVSLPAGVSFSSSAGLLAAPLPPAAALLAPAFALLAPRVRRRSRTLRES